jgi:hypothetical protein
LSGAVTADRHEYPEEGVGVTVRSDIKDVVEISRMLSSFSRASKTRESGV